MELTDAALDYIMDKSYDPVYGARPIRRWLEKKVVTELSRMLVGEELDENSTAKVKRLLYCSKFPMTDAEVMKMKVEEIWMSKCSVLLEKRAVRLILQ
ncbi:hypothetical protein M0R45_037313 [Rubus argutus]|uniref:Clp ATPase C-terminal domain-containing protein n=1 Tax=Rubus argutus TaxID=59490 RepID=A0AAW1W1J9_RUBAR